MLRILIVDDQVDDLSHLSEILTSYNFSFETALSGKQAFEKIKVHHFDVIISDFQMEDGDGLWLVTEVKKLDPKIYFILVSSDFSQTEDFYQSFGVDCFLPKTIHTPSLLLKLDEIKSFLI